MQLSVGVKNKTSKNLSPGVSVLDTM